jgi:phosphoribosylanthranilate isomerase
MTEVKICGLRRPEDVKMARDADYHGFVVGTGTRRSLSPEKAADLMSLSSRPTVVVTTSADPNYLLDIAHKLKPHALQLNGPVSAGDVERLSREAGCRIWVAYAVDGSERDFPQDIMRCADLVVLDTYSRQGGGEGRTHDWDVSARLRSLTKKNIALAGGLRPENVAEAIARIGPDLVDVSSGVEVEGRKDAVRIREFIEAVRRCDK